MSWLFFICFSRSIFHPICFALYRRLTSIDSTIQALQLLVEFGQCERLEKRGQVLYFPFLCWATFGSGCISLFIVTAFIRHLLPNYGSYWVPLKSCLPRSFRLKSSHCYQSLIVLPLLLGSLNPFYYMITSVNCPFIKLFLPFEYAISSVRRGGNQSASI